MDEGEVVLPATGSETLILRRASSIADSDEVLQGIYEARSRLATIELRVAHELENEDFGGVSSVLQAISSWAASDPSRIFHSYIDSDWSDERILTLFRERLHVLTAVIAARAVLASGRQNITSRAKKLAQAAAAVQDIEPIVQQEHVAALIAYESEDRWTSVNRILYAPVAPRRWAWDPSQRRRAWVYPANRPPKVKRGAEFSGAIEAITDQLVLTGSLASAQGFADISLAISELFENAHKWGQTAPGGTPVKPSFRAVRMEWLIRTKQRLQQLGEGDEAIREYLSDAGHSDSDRASHLEISVVDFGPGLFAHRMLRMGDARVQDPRAQFDAVRECLVDGSTDDPSAGGEGRGHGFTNIFEALTNLGGVLRIRTGALSLSRYFGAWPFGRDEYNAPWIADSSGGRDVAEHPAVRGTAVTIVVPIRRGD